MGKRIFKNFLTLPYLKQCKIKVVEAVEKNNPNT